MLVVDLVGAALRRRAMAVNLKYLEVALAQAAQRIMVAARGELSPTRWHRRVRVAIEKLERAKLSIVDYVVAKSLDMDEAKAIVDAIDDTIAALAEQVDLVPLPEEIRLLLSDLDVPSRLVH
jgi:hypothetical protein